jgi:protein TonB
MRNPARARANLARLVLFAAVAGLHAVLLLFLVVKVNASLPAAEQPPPTVMKLTDIEEEPYYPIQPMAAQQAEVEYTEAAADTVEALAENMVETDEDPGLTVVSGIIGTPGGRGSGGYGLEGYLPMHKVSVAPVFNEIDIKSKLVYPPIALRAKIEGMVYLELFVDHTGSIRQITILRETPENRGFGEAAIKAFEGMKGTPAQANGAAVAVRYRYPVRFAIRS